LSRGDGDFFPGETSFRTNRKEMRDFGRSQSLIICQQLADRPATGVGHEPYGVGRCLGGKLDKLPRVPDFHQPISATLFGGFDHRPLKPLECLLSRLGHAPFRLEWHQTGDT
jgi:hypothetical protein